MTAGRDEGTRWVALRTFLQVPPQLTGAGVRVAVVDGTFAPHPDVASDARRRTYHVLASSQTPGPALLEAEAGPWTGSAQHGVAAAAAAAGSGALSGGRYAGVAPEAELYLVAGWLRGVTRDSQDATRASLRWLLAHGNSHGIRAVLTAHSGPYGTGLLPWQLDPIRVLCEALAAEGFLVIAGTGNVGDLTCLVSQAQAPSALAVGGVVVPPEESAATRHEAAPFSGSRGVTSEGKWVPQILGPAQNLVLPLLGSPSEHGHIYDGPDYGVVPPGYIRLDGTSFAGPAVLGAAACVWQAHPEWTALQVREALLSTALQAPQWAALGSGLVSVANAVNARPASATGDARGETSYARYRRWRQVQPEERLRVLDAPPADGEDALDALDALLSFLPLEAEESDQSLPAAALGPLRALLEHPDYRLRTGTLCVLAGSHGALGVDDLERALADPARHVRAAALYALERNPGRLAALVPALVRCFADDSLDVRRAALQLAAKAGDQRLVRPLVEGMEEDARRHRLGNYSARRAALETLTGKETLELPAWRRGECFDSAERWQIRQRTAAAWRDWLPAER